MTNQEALFRDLGAKFTDAAAGNLFGKPCFKKGGRAFLCFFRNELVCKLSGEDRDAALALEGAQLFDPSGKGRPMKDWVQLPSEKMELWGKFAALAFRNISETAK